MGSLFHDTLSKYGTLLEAESSWDSVTEEQSGDLLDRALREAEENAGSEALADSAAGAYTLTCVRRILKRSIWAITEQIRRSGFRPDGYEIPFEREEDEARSRLVGYVDRMDVCETEESVFVRVIDYKSSVTKVDLVEIYYGRQFQLVVYLDTALRSLRARFPDRKIVPAGIFYLHLDDPMMDNVSDEDDVESERLSALRMEGYVNEDPGAFRQMDRTLEADQRSEVAPISLNQEGLLNRVETKPVSSADFAAIIAYVRAYMDGAVEEILSGKIDLKPYRRGTATGCEHCVYRSVCGFEHRIPGYDYKEQKSIVKNVLLEEFREAAEHADE